MSQVYALLKHEIDVNRRLISFVLIIVGVIYLLYTFFTSKTLQLAVFMLIKIQNDVSFYHIVSLPLLKYLIPMICLMLVYDSVSKDIRQEKIRLIIAKVKRKDYILSKILSNFLLILVLIFIVVGYVTIYAHVSLKISFLTNLSLEYINSSFNLFISLALVSLFACSLFVLVSTFFKNPLFISVIISIASFVLTSVPGMKRLSFFSYATLDAMQFHQLVFLICGSILIIMTTVYLFNHKNL